MVVALCFGVEQATGFKWLQHGDLFRSPVEKCPFTGAFTKPDFILLLASNNKPTKLKSDRAFLRGGFSWELVGVPLEFAHRVLWFACHIRRKLFEPCSQVSRLCHRSLFGASVNLFNATAFAASGTKANGQWAMHLQFLL